MLFRSGIKKTDSVSVCFTLKASGGMDFNRNIKKIFDSYVKISPVGPFEFLSKGGAGVLRIDWTRAHDYK